MHERSSLEVAVGGADGAGVGWRQMSGGRKWWGRRFWEITEKSHTVLESERDRLRSQNFDLISEF